jgi:phosphatidylserine decarboxylase
LIVLLHTCIQLPHLKPQFSPVDGRVLHYGLVKGDFLEQIKGIKYSLKEFMGENSPLDQRLPYLPKPEEFQYS